MFPFKGKCSGKPSLLCRTEIPSDLEDPAGRPIDFTDRSNILTCSKNSKTKPLKGNNVIYEVSTEPMTGKHYLDILLIENNYCIKPSDPCQCFALINKIMKQKVDWAHGQIVAEFVSRIEVAPYASYQTYLTFIGRCICILKSAYMNDFRYVQMNQNINPSPECTEKHHIEAGGMGEIGGEICYGWEEAKCGNNAITLTRE